MRNEEYNNSLGSWLREKTGIGEIRDKEIDTLAALANQPAKISPLVYIIPVIAVGIFAGIYFIILKKKKSGQ